MVNFDYKFFLSFYTNDLYVNEINILSEILTFKDGKPEFTVSIKENEDILETEISFVKCDIKITYVYVVFLTKLILFDSLYKRMINHELDDDYFMNEIDKVMSEDINQLKEIENQYVNPNKNYSKRMKEIYQMIMIMSDEDLKKFNIEYLDKDKQYLRYHYL